MGKRFILILFLLFIASESFGKTRHIPVSTAKNPQHLTAAAFDGNNFFVVWEDSRNDTAPFLNADIYGARVSSSGMLLDTEGIKIATTGKDELNPSISFDGKDFLVVWVEDGRRILARRITTQGDILDKTPIEISSTKGLKRLPSTAFNGKEHFVVWTGYRAEDDMYAKADIYGRRITKAGKLIDKNDITLSSADMDETYPAILWQKKNYFLVRLRTVLKDKRVSREIIGSWIKKNGTSKNTDEIVIASLKNDTVPRIVNSTNNSMVVWSDMTAQNGYDIFAVRISAKGKIIDKTPVAITAVPRDQFNPFPAFDGKNYIITWTDHRNHPVNPDIYINKINPKGKINAGPPIKLIYDTKMPINPIIHYAKSKSRYLIGWTDYTADNGNFTNSDIRVIILKDVK